MAANGWTLIRLGSVSTKIGSGATPRGGGDVYFDNGPYTLIRSQNVYNDGFRHDGLAFIGKEHASELNNAEVQKGDVLLNITGDSVARCCQVDASILPARVNQHVAIIRPDPKKLDPRFLKYLLVSPEMQTQLLSWAGSGGTRNALTKGMIESLEIVVPEDVVEQSAIARFLGTFDDKIDLNRGVNETLESVARAIFKSWFVDFKPVRSKTEGRDTGLPKHIADLFPNSFVDSELGEIPSGWEMRGLDKIAVFLNGLALQKYPPKDGSSLPVIKIAQLRKGNTDRADKASIDLDPNYIVADGDVLFSWSGSLECVFWAGGPGALNQHLFKVSSTYYPKWFYYLWIHEHLKNFRHIAAGKATTMGHIQRHHLSDAKAIIPNPGVFNAANNLIAPIIDRIIHLRIESRTLAALRDTLLPKLINGELRVKESERFIERTR